MKLLNHKAKQGVWKTKGKNTVTTYRTKIR